jgi:hypothetical protein
MTSGTKVLLRFKASLLGISMMGQPLKANPAGIHAGPGVGL